MNICETSINGCYELFPKILEDKRGAFIKTFNEPLFKELGLSAEFKEEYFSISYKNVIRGLHFQTPPFDHDKIVYCLIGDVTDVVVDLRKESPTYGCFQEFSLNETDRNMVYIPSGLAHGFLVKSDKAILLYKVTTSYSPEHDSGIHWNSINYKWSVENPIISERDSKLIELINFKSPF